MENEKDKHVLKVYLKACRNSSLDTIDWLRELLEKEALDLKTLRDWQEEWMQANEKLRKKLIKRFNLNID